MPDRQLDLRPLYPIFEEVSFLARDELHTWLLEEIRAITAVADDLMDTAKDMGELERASAALRETERALTEWINHHTSGATVATVRAWSLLELHDDPVTEMKAQMLRFLPAVDALAFLVRPATTP